MVTVEEDGIVKDKKDGSSEKKKRKEKWRSRSEMREEPQPRMSQNHKEIV